MTRARRRVLLAEIGPAHGIRGEITARVYTSEPDGLMAYGDVEDETGQRAFRVTSVRTGAKSFIIRVHGIADRTAAEGLRGVKLFVPRERLPDPEPGTYYHEDLVGLSAVSPEGVELGTVAAVQNFGAGDLVEIAVSGSTRTELVPLERAFVPEVDIAAGRIVVSMPAYDADEDGSSTD